MPRPAPRLAPVTTATGGTLCVTRTTLRADRHRFVDDRQIAIADRVDNRIDKRRAREEQTPCRVRGQVLRIAPLQASRRRLGIPLHAGLIPTALACQYARPAPAAGDRHHRGVGESVVGPDGHHVVPGGPERVGLDAPSSTPRAGWWCRPRTRSARSSRAARRRRRRRTARTSGAAGRPGRPPRTAAGSGCAPCSSRSRRPARSPSAEHRRVLIGDLSRRLVVERPRGFLTMRPYCSTKEFASIG